MLARDLTEPSPLALEVLSARPYAFLDDAPLEERRTQAVMSRRWLDPETAADIGKLDSAVIVKPEIEHAIGHARDACLLSIPPFIEHHNRVTLGSGANYGEIAIGPPAEIHCHAQRLTPT